MAALASSDADPIFDLIAQHRTARDFLTKAEEAHSLVEREMHASGDLYPGVTSRGNPFSGLPRPISKTHSDIDMYSPADHYPDDNKREHDELAASIARRDARRLPIEEAMNAAWDAEREVLETLVQTVPTTMPGVMAMLKFQRDCDGNVGLEMFEPWHLSFLCESVETALLNLQSRGWQGVGMV
jgi:hypothetical protein